MLTLGFWSIYLDICQKYTIMKWRPNDTLDAIKFFNSYSTMTEIFVEIHLFGMF